MYRIPCDDASDGRRLNQLRSMAMLSERVGSVKSRTMPLAFAEPPPSLPAPPPPRAALSPPLPSNGFGAVDTTGSIDDAALLGTITPATPPIPLQLFHGHLPLYNTNF